MLIQKRPSSTHLKCLTLKGKVCWGRTSKWQFPQHIDLQYVNWVPAVLKSSVTLYLTDSSYSSWYNSILREVYYFLQVSYVWRLFLPLCSVTQMLTTQADRFSAEEVHCDIFCTNCHHYGWLLSAGNRVWKIQGRTSPWHTLTAASETFSCQIWSEKIKKWITPFCTEWVICHSFV